MLVDPVTPRRARQSPGSAHGTGRPRRLAAQL